MDLHGSVAVHLARVLSERVTAAAVHDHVGNELVAVTVPYPGQEVEVLGGDEVLVEDIAGETLGIERRVAGEELEQPLTCELVDRAVAQGNRLGRACPEVRDEAPGYQCHAGHVPEGGGDRPGPRRRGPVI